VEVVQMRVAEMLKHPNPSTPIEEELRRLIQSKAGAFEREIEAQFMKAGILGVPASCKSGE
jgi:hypothetical protein